MSAGWSLSVDNDLVLRTTLKFGFAFYPLCKYMRMGAGGGGGGGGGGGITICTDKRASAFSQ